MNVMRKTTEVMRIGGKFDSQMNGLRVFFPAVTERGV